MTDPEQSEPEIIDITHSDDLITLQSAAEVPISAVPPEVFSEAARIDDDEDDEPLPNVDTLIVPISPPPPSEDHSLLRSVDRTRPVPLSPAPAAMSSVDIHGIHIAVSSQIGERPTNEDAHIMCDLNMLAREAARGKALAAPAVLVGVYDGHADHVASNYVSQELPFQLVLNRNFPEATELALVRAYEYTHRRFAAFSAIDNVDSGTTALTAVFLGRELWIANAGDCRAVLVHTDGRATALSEDHSPECPRERQRVEDLGGTITCEDGTYRVNGILSVTRGIGDIGLRPAVTEHPDVRHVAPTRNDAVVILACDGLWSVIENEDLAAEAQAAAKRGATPEEFVAEMCRGAIGAGCRDNVTIACICLPGGWEALRDSVPRDDKLPIAASFDDPEAAAAAEAAVKEAMASGKSSSLRSVLSFGRCNVL